jgi:uncharacterized damage-inducible protein DinB
MQVGFPNHEVSFHPTQYHLDNRMQMITTFSSEFQGVYMKDFLIEMAQYNKKVNLAFKELLVKTDTSILTKDCGAFYHSIIGTAEHILTAEIMYLRRFSTFGEYKSLKTNNLMVVDVEELKKRVEKNIELLFATLEETDTLVINFLNEVSENEIQQIVKYRYKDGPEIAKPYWAVIFSILNHGTHHRGEISALLDIQKVSNNITGFTQYIE